MRLYLIFCIIIYILQFDEGKCIENTVIKNGSLRIEIVRQKTVREQLLNNHHYIKFDKKLRKLFKPPTPPRTNDSIALRRYLDKEFYGQVVVGHPGQTLNVAFDTAWSLTWLISSQCNPIKTYGCLFHNRYDHSKSSEYKPDGRPYVADEGTYNLTGFFSYENISIAHVNVTNQSFVEMVNIPNEFLFNKADGILGLGFQTSDYEPFFYTLVRQKKIVQNLFSIYLNRDRQSTRGGNVLLGLIDYDHVEHKKVNGKNIYSNITYLPVSSDHYWQFAIDKIYLGGWYKEQNTFVLCPNGCQAIVDATTNVILGPSDDIDRIHETIQATEVFFGRYTVECEIVNKMPKIDFNLNGINFTISSADYVIKMSYKSITVCVSAFMKDDVEPIQGMWVLGGAFLAEYYSIYNIDEKKIGFVKAA